MIELSLKAYWRRIKQFRSPWSPYLQLEKREIPLISLDTIKRREEKYLRATLGCDPYTPEIVGMAQSLAERCRNKREYAEKIFEFVKNQILLAIENPSRGAADTLKRGYGVCFEKMNLLIALARAGGIPARYVMENVISRQWEGGFEYLLIAQSPQDDEGLRDFMEENFHRNHDELSLYVELLIDGFWVPAFPLWEDERMAGHDLPIFRLGDHPQIATKASNFVTTEETMESLTSFPLRRDSRRRFSMILGRGLLDYVNERMENMRRIGRRKLDKIGEDKYIESKKKFYFPVPPRIDLSSQRNKPMKMNNSK